MSDFTTISAATSPVLGSAWTGEAARVRRTAPPVYTVKGTGLPIAGAGIRFGVGIRMGADQLQGIGVVRAAVAADHGIPPRRRPVRC